MKSRITKLAAAAVIVLGVYFGLCFIGGPDIVNVAWANVSKRVTQVDYVHVYYLKSRDNVLKMHFEGWYAYGKLVIRGNGGDMTYDDGQTLQGFDKDKRRTVKRPSQFAKGQTFLEVFSAGLLSDKNEQFNQQTPVNVGDDFLIYRFDPPCNDSKWEDVESVSMTVGKNSILPVQMKIYHKDNDYDLLMFDYEAGEKEVAFFEAPAVEAPHGRCELLLDGAEVMIALAGAPGIKAAIVSLHSKPADASGEGVFALDVAFITEEGYRSRTNNLIRLHRNEAVQCGVGADWPDGKYRNIRFSPLLKATDRADVFVVEIWCWIRTEKD